MNDNTIRFKMEPLFERDNFGNHKELRNADSLAINIINILKMKPGNLPSLPHIGVDISKYLYSTDTTIDRDVLLEQIENQCRELLPYLRLSNFNLYVLENSSGLIYFLLTLEIYEKLAAIRIDRNAGSGNVLYSFEWVEKD